MKRKTTSRRQTQLDRIERKLDELLKRQPIVLSPQTWQLIDPHRPPEEPHYYPTGPFGQPGYQPITPRTPAWDDPGEDKEEKK